MVLWRGVPVVGPPPEDPMLPPSCEVEPVVSAVTSGPAWLLRMASQVVMARAIWVSWTKRSIIVHVI